MKLISFNNGSDMLALQAMFFAEMPSFPVAFLGLIYR